MPGLEQKGEFPSCLALSSLAAAQPGRFPDDGELLNKKTPTPCLWQAAASTQIKPKGKPENQAGHSSERAVEGQQPRFPVNFFPPLAFIRTARSERRFWDYERRYGL